MASSLHNGGLEHRSMNPLAYLRALYKDFFVGRFGSVAVRSQ